MDGVMCMTIPRLSIIYGFFISSTVLAEVAFHYPHSLARFFSLHLIPSPTSPSGFILCLTIFIWWFLSVIVFFMDYTYEVFRYL